MIILENWQKFMIESSQLLVNCHLPNFTDLAYYFGIVQLKLHIFLNYGVAKDCNSYEDFHKMDFM